MSEDKTILTELKNKYIRIRIAEILLLTLGLTLLLYCVLRIIDITLGAQIAVLLFASILVFTFRFFQLDLHRITEKSVASFLNTRYAELSGGVDLMLSKEESLSTLAQIQQKQTFKTLQSLKIQFPNQFKILLPVVILAIAVFTTISVTDFKIKTDSVVSSNTEQSLKTNTIIENLPAELSEANISISPPSYTGLKNYAATDLNLSVPENSQVTWTLKLSQPVKKVGVLISSQDTAWLTSKNDQWKLSIRLERSGFYHLVWKDEETHASAYYKIEIKKDQPPVIELTNLDQFTQVAFDSKKQIAANPTITDDYGLHDAYIIATVSKGSGESVKFREERIKFNETVSGKRVKAKQLLDLNKLGMEPGDELYFYIEALDNKTPLPNRTRTETYFITIPDTAQDVMAADGGLGVDLMPEYFRSQRQIIIDTEKLIRERKTISKQEFNSRSNELGYDQKVLRLRYGQFLGEEDESAPATTENHDDDHDENEKPEDIIKEFGHQHDTENEHNLVEEKDPTKRGVDGTKNDDLLAAFGHKHDTEESATFFFQSLKLKLKAALAQMWDAELYLRLYEPEKSLPYQYTALKLLKEISNDSRIYVHRTGFEPPPIKEEKRLSADLNEVFNSTNVFQHEKNLRFTKISDALRIVEKLLAQNAQRISGKEKNTLVQSGNELAQAALENPSLLEGLSALRQITDHAENIESKSLLTLRKAYWQSLPVKPVPAGKNNSILHTLDGQLLKQLEVPEQ